MAWVDVVLTTDADLKKWESRMPELGQLPAGPGAERPYDGKRALVKSRITTALRRRDMNPDGLLRPVEELGDLAAWLELSFIFRDMAKQEGSLYAEKADYYMRLYQNEWDGIALTYEEPSSGDEPEASRSFGTISISRG